MKQRLEWLDALRGFTMLMVVANHVYGMGFTAPTKTSMFMSLCLLFRMPLFFFVSGFLAYKASFSWNLADTGRLVAKKLRVQIIPTLVFMTAYIALTAKHFWEKMETAWMSPTKGGYWFTLVLLEMFLVYYLICYALSRLPRQRELPTDPELCSSARDTQTASSPPSWERWGLSLLWLLSLLAYSTMYMPRWFTWPKEELWQVTSATELIRYFHFFLFGNIVHRYWPQFQRLLDSRWFLPLVILVAFVGAADYLNWHNLRREWANLPRTLAMYSLVTLIVAFFRNYAGWFTKDRAVGRALQYVGMRTLDVYLIHYFFIPHIPALGAWLKATKAGFVVEGSIALAIAILVTAFALLTSNVLRTSPLLRKWLFGRE